MSMTVHQSKIIFQIFFCTPPRDSDYTHVKLLEVTSQLSDALFVFLKSFFSLCFILNSFYSCVLKFTNLFFCDV